MAPILALPPEIVYPESDGEPMAENTVQLDWIVLLYDNLCALFRDRSDVFVAADLFWYPVEGDPSICTAPDVLVVFGRPKGHRSSYMQWVENGVPLTVVIEVLSPKNTVPDMSKKLAFYEEYGVEEYYLFDPDTNQLFVYLRRGQAFVARTVKREFVSPRLGIRFDLTGEDMVVFNPDGNRFLTYLERMDLQTQAEQQAIQAQQQAIQAQEQAAQAQRRARRLADLGRKVRQQLATEQELAELEALENELHKRESSP